MRFKWCLVLAALAAVGCGNTDDEFGSAGLPGGVALTYEGIYQIGSWTEDDAGCSGAGNDLLATTTEPHFALVADEVLGASTLMLVSCVDVVDCRAKVTAIRNRQPFGAVLTATLSEQVGADELSGYKASTGFEENGVCTRREYDDHRLTRAGSNATLTTQVKGLADKPTENGFCTVQAEAVEQEAAGAPCVASSIVEGTRVSDL
jgi:hypothetical protein